MIENTCANVQLVSTSIINLATNFLEKSLKEVKECRDKFVNNIKVKSC